jgi:predicted permease
MMFSIPISCYTYTVGYCMLTRSKVSLKKLFNPINIAMLVGAAVGLLGWKVPTVAESFFAKAAGCMAPAGMLLMGMVISEYKLKELFLNKQAYVITFFRLLMIPCLVGWVLQLFSLEILLLPTLLIMAMPCGSNTVIFPKLVGEDCKTGAALALITSILCCLTIPLCLFLFGFAAF